jgi:hypothetical protein
LLLVVLTNFLTKFFLLGLPLSFDKFCENFLDLKEVLKLFFLSIKKDFFPDRSEDVESIFY